MKIKINYFKSLCFLFILLGGTITDLTAQSRVTIIQADELEGGILGGETIRKILGDVILSTEDMLMETDSVYQYVDRNLLVAYNAQIETENEIIWADILYHNTDTEFSRLKGRVIVQSETNTVFSDSVEVDNQNDLAIFNVPIRFEDETGTLIAESGLYFQDADSAVFRGNVQLSDSTQYLEADSLFMNRSDELYELFGRVYADDFEDNVKFTGSYLYADSTGYRLLEENAWLMEVSESKADTTHLLAEKIEILETDSASFMDAYTDVTLWSSKFSAIADTANYRDDLDQFILRSSPKLWQKNIQLTGPYVEAFLEDDDIRFLESYIRPIVVQEDSLTGRLHQMTGDTLHAYFSEGDVERIRVFNNAEIIFHQKDENNDPDGLIELISAGPSTMFFLNGDIDEFKAEQNIDGSYLPEDPANINRRLGNFSWNPELKPERPQVRTPRLRPIPDERPFALPPRYVKYLNLKIESVDSEEPAELVLPLNNTENSLPRYTIIVYSFLVESQAEDAADQLKEEGLQSGVLPAMVDGTQYYRVAIGRYSSWSEAISSAEDLPSPYNSEFFIVKTP